MACMNIGSKPDVFVVCEDGKKWLCKNGLESDIIVKIGSTIFHLHKFPLLSRSGVFENSVRNFCGGNETNCVLELQDVPGGAETFLLVTKFCYGVEIELTASNVVSLHCVADFLQMTEEFGERNLVSQTDFFLQKVLGDWNDTLKALETCDVLLPLAEEIQIVSRCIDSLATKVCADTNEFSWPMSGDEQSFIWNKTRTAENWWYDDVSSLKFSFFKKLIIAAELKGVKPKSLAGAIIHYTNKHLTLLSRDEYNAYVVVAPNLFHPSDIEERNLLEDIVELLPQEKGVIQTKFLVKLLRTSVVLGAGPMCREILEKLVGAQLKEVLLEDILIPNPVGCPAGTFYDVECVQRILGHFMLADEGNIGQIAQDPFSLTAITTVAKLIDEYLAEVAADKHLKWNKFMSLAGAIPDYARAFNDGIYRAIDLYLMAHSWLTSTEREQLCRLMDCQKLSLEASTHAAQNERLPLRVVVQVIYCEQLRLRTSVSDCIYLSGNLGTPHNQSGDLSHRTDDCILSVADLKERFSDLEKECSSMKEELEKLRKAKGSWHSFLKKFSSVILKPKCSERNRSKTPPPRSSGRK